MKQSRLTRLINYQKTLMAYYWLSDEEGLLCTATWKELSTEIGLNSDTVKGHAKRLEEKGIIRVSQIRRADSRRTVILIDHPKAAEFLASKEAALLPRTKENKLKEIYKHEYYPDYDNDNYEDEYEEILPRVMTSASEEPARTVLTSNHETTLSAIQKLAEPDEMRCYASIAEIARKSGLSKTRVFRCLDFLSKQSIIRRAAIPDRDRRRRPLVLLSHPAAIEYLQKNAEHWGPLSGQIELNREREKEKSKGKPSTPVAEIG